MISNPFFLLSILLNTALAFFTATFFVEAILILLRIRNERSQALLRLFPFCSMLLDRLFSEFSLVNWLNPLSCNSCIQKFFLKVFFPQLNSHLMTEDLSLINHLASRSPLHLSTLIFIAFSLLTTFFVTRKIMLIIRQNRQLHSIIRTSLPCNRPIEIRPLSAALIAHGAEVKISDEIEVPMALYTRMILIPTAVIDKVSQEEYEAILAHELEHIRWKDPQIRQCAQLIASLFWWVPTQWWMRKVIQTQEIASDKGISSYAVKQISLATALVKVSQFIHRSKGEAHSDRFETLCAMVAKNNFTVDRLRLLVDPTSTKKEFLGIGLIGAGIEALILVICFL